MQKAPYAFIALGIAFIAIGISGQRALLFIGIAFLVIAFIGLFRFRSRS
jgi:hypothetical protein